MEYRVYSFRLHKFSLKQGFRPIRAEPNKYNDIFTVWVYQRSEAFDNIIIWWNENKK